MNYFKDNSNFYPTPKELIEKMFYLVGGENVWNKIDTLLEPSAGKGDIVDFIENHNYYRYRDRKITIDCIENDKTLQATLKGKEHRLVYDDFLSYFTENHYDAIIMNPPFEKGDLHLLKAINIAENNGGCIIVCILNAETIRNPYTNSRKVLLNKFEKYSAKIEYIVDAFSSAERSSNVEIALLRIEVPCEKFSSVFVDNLEKAQDVSFQGQKVTEIVPDDPIEQMVTYYNKEVELVTNFIKEYLAIQPYLKSSFAHSDDSDFEKETKTESYIWLRAGGGKYGSSSSHTIENYSDINTILKIIRRKYWNNLFHNKEFTSMLTSDMQNKLCGRVSEMSNYDFNMFNIDIIKKSFIQSLLDDIDTSICNLFVKLTSEFTYFDYSKNIHYFNGWKSNKAHKVNTKVVIPFNGAFAESWYHKLLQEYPIVSLISDIEKVFNYIDMGETVSHSSVENITHRANILEQSRNIEYKYFNCTFYKKGTCHIKFTNQEVLDKLNIYMSRKNNWLPPSYGKVDYDEMTAKEKQVIDDFQGEEAYRKVYANPSKYILETSQMLALPQKVDIT